MPKPSIMEEKHKGKVAAPSTVKQSGGRLAIFLAVVLAVVGYAIQSRQQLSKDVPDAYILCTPDDAKVYTVDTANSRAQCVAVNGSYIIGVGSLGDVQGKLDASRMPVFYTPPGSSIVPGMTDSHCHILEYGASKIIPLEEGKTIKEVVASIRNYILENPDIHANKSKIIEGWGWDHTVWPEKRWPVAADLEEDPVIRGRPVVLQSKDGHGIWVSRATLEANMPFIQDMEGGVIARDANGDASGLFLDDAQDLVELPTATDESLYKKLDVTVKTALSFGLTSLHDAALKPESLAFFERQAAQGTLPIRIYGMRFFNESEEYWGDKVKPIIGAGDGRLHSRSVKMFGDGALRTGGAALYEPYFDNPSTSGFMRLSNEAMDNTIPRFLRDGWQVNVHAIGDRANGLVLDAFERALDGVDVVALRPRLEHAQLLSESDMKRFGKLGVIASVQPTHVTDDMWYAEDRLGPERIKGLYAFRSILDNNARITLGSDFPVEGPNPLAGFFAAITRVAEDGSSPHGPGGWFPEQKLTRQEALRGLTIDPAYASFTEDTLGSLEVGKRCDLVVLSQDIMTIPVDQILKTKVLATVMDGKPVYGGY